MSLIKNYSDLKALEKAGTIVHNVLTELELACHPGISTMAIERLACQLLLQHRSTMPFKQFANASNQLFGFATCISLNDEIVNGLPSQERLIQSGDIVSIATAAEHRGLYAKAARSFFVGTLSPPEAVTRLLSGTRIAIEQAVINAGQCNTLNDLLCYIPQVAASFQLTVIEMMGGQQIGKKLHGEIPTPNNPKELDWVVPLQPGLCFTLMPMFSLGTQSAIQVGKDGWVYHTADGALSAHVAETLLMTESGLVVITRSE